MTARQEASGEALEQVLQECEQDMSATNEALSDIRRVGALAGKWKMERGWLTSTRGTSCGNKAHWRLTLSCCSAV